MLWGFKKDLYQIDKVIWHRDAKYNKKFAEYTIHAIRFVFSIPNDFTQNREIRENALSRNNKGKWSNKAMTCGETLYDWSINTLYFTRLHTARKANTTISKNDKNNGA